MKLICVEITFPYAPSSSLVTYTDIDKNLSEKHIYLMLNWFIYKRLCHGSRKHWLHLNLCPSIWSVLQRIQLNLWPVTTECLQSCSDQLWWERIWSSGTCPESLLMKSANNLGSFNFDTIFQTLRLEFWQCALRSSSATSVIDLWSWLLSLVVLLSLLGEALAIINNKTSEAEAVLL